MNKIVSMPIINLGTPKAGAKHELLFNEPASGFKCVSFIEKPNCTKRLMFLFSSSCHALKARCSKPSVFCSNLMFFCHAENGQTLKL